MCVSDRRQVLGQVEGASGLGWELIPAWGIGQVVEVYGELDQQPPEEKPGQLSVSKSAQDSRSWELHGEAAGSLLLGELYLFQ